MCSTELYWHARLSLNGHYLGLARVHSGFKPSRGRQWLKNPFPPSPTKKKSSCTENPYEEITGHIFR